MKIYTQDYTLPFFVNALLALASEKIRQDNIQDAERLLEDARDKLDQYLSQDNMIPDDDAEGWIRSSDLLGDGDDCELI